MGRIIHRHQIQILPAFAVAAARVRSFAASSSAIQLSGWFPAPTSIRLPTMFPYHMMNKKRSL